MHLRLGQKQDTGGKLALSGNADQRILEALLEHPYFLMEAPKSLDHYRARLPDSLDALEEIGKVAANPEPEGFVRDAQSVRFRPEQVRGNAEPREVLQRCIRALPETFRQVFVMRDQEGETTTTICEQLGLSVSNFNVIMHRARKQLRECFLQHGIESLKL
jgi:RNA polymerase sigma factor (sigma-70 family)